MGKHDGRLATCPPKAEGVQGRVPSGRDARQGGSCPPPKVTLMSNRRYPYVTCMCQAKLAPSQLGGRGWPRGLTAGLPPIPARSTTTGCPTSPPRPCESKRVGLTQLRAGAAMDQRLPSPAGPADDEPGKAAWPSRPLDLRRTRSNKTGGSDTLSTPAMEGVTEAWINR